MTETELSLDDLDKLLAEPETQEITVPALNEKPKRRTHLAIKDMIVNGEVAKALVEGVPITVLATRLGVTPQQIRKWTYKMEMKDLIAIEARRLIRHMSRRDLKGEKYLGLTTALSYLIDKERGLRDGVEPEAQVLNQTTIEQINVFLSRRGHISQSAKDDPGVQELGPGDVREISEKLDESGTTETPGADGSGGKG